MKKFRFIVDVTVEGNDDLTSEDVSRSMKDFEPDFD